MVKCVKTRCQFNKIKVFYLKTLSDEVITVGLQYFFEFLCK